VALLLVLAAAALTGPLSVSLPGGAINGTPVLGRNVTRVEEALGAPSSVETFPNRRDLVYRGRMEAIFHGPAADPGGQIAWAVLVTDPAATAPGLGRLLAVPPRTLERRLRAAGLREERRYRCDARGCFGTFFGAGGRRRIIYGVHDGGRYLGVQVWPNP
jgi:hypothetical protein